MRVGMIDVDNHTKLDSCFPNIALMKLSSYHKEKGDIVEWYDHDSPVYDKVYMSKVFSFTEDYPFDVNAIEIHKGGSGYCISVVNGKEVFDKNLDNELPCEVEHSFPDYSLYGITDTAYGFLSRGCPRGCGFCHVASKEGKCSIKVADLSEFWDGQKEIQIMDPNILACKDWKDLLQQLIDSKANVEFNQGLDIRLMTKEKAEMLKQIKIKSIHFAWDRYEDKEIIQRKFEIFTDVVGKKYNRSKSQCYVLTNYDTSYEQDLERVMWLRQYGISPYIMRYQKETIPRGHYLNALARWCNLRQLFWKYGSLEEYKEARKKYKI